ncbi:tRNA pseudouridine(55) synthase TruB [Moraxella sp. ZY21109]|nr:tRNA pseudouridine(55) synthase TruB [Moraxella sp. ZY210820]WLF83583.1 tRNA pseudouridine(55) synthase TruB [Moraxella sp. ZY210820]
MSKAKILRRAIHGVFLLNKPLGLSSNQALQKVRYLFRAEKAGHTGALDPLASGLLPICLGEATKFSHYLLDAKKCYRTTIRLGQATSTGDVEGNVIVEKNIPSLSKDTIEQVLQQFLGKTQQIPPMYSALKKDGRPLYELARQGIEIERQPRNIEIDRLTLLHFDEQSLSLEVSCSKGTYVRILGEDIAQALGTVGHLTALHRIETGHFQLNETYTIEYLESLSESEREQLLLPVFAPVQHLPQFELVEERVKYFCNGQESSVDYPATDELLVFYQGRCLGLAQVNNKGRLIPKRLLNLPLN